MQDVVGVATLILPGLRPVDVDVVYPGWVTHPSPRSPGCGCGDPGRGELRDALNAPSVDQRRRLRPGVVKLHVGIGVNTKSYVPCDELTAYHPSLEQRGRRLLVGVDATIQYGEMRAARTGPQYRGVDDFTVDGVVRLPDGVG